MLQLDNRHLHFYGIIVEYGKKFMNIQKEQERRCVGKSRHCLTGPNLIFFKRVQITPVNCLTRRERALIFLRVFPVKLLEKVCVSVCVLFGK